MNSGLSSAYATLYLAFGAVAAIAVLLRLTRRLTSGQRLLSGALVCPLVALYLIGMHRSAGLDFDTYLSAYTDQGQSIPDLGYTALTLLFRQAGVDFSTFLLCQGIFTLGVTWYVAKARQADPLVVVVVYLLHLAIVRDMSQSRIGLAVAVYLLGQTRERASLRALLYVFAASIHITVLVLMFAWTAARLTSRLPRSMQVLTVYLPLAAFATFGLALLEGASWFDPRIELYLAWDEPSYGAPLESFGSLALMALVTAAYVAASRRFKDLRLREYVLMELAGAAILIAFAQFSIFAARLSNVAVSMYPIGLGIVAMAYRTHRAPAAARMSGLVGRIAVVATLATLLIRPGSFEALAEVVPTAFEFAVD
jgi:hypothetical protein